MNALARAAQQADALIDTLTRGENIGDVTLVDELRALRRGMEEALNEELQQDADHELGAIIHVLQDAVSLGINIDTSDLRAILRVADRLHRASRRHDRADAPASPPKGCEP